VHFEAENINDIQKEFEASVDDYLEACKEFGQEPQKPKSGKLAVRIAPEIHEMVATAASNDAKSINQWITEVLEKAARERLAEKSIKIKVR
jgi:predicted HicB family RNase H-like nuclease